MKNKLLIIMFCAISGVMNGQTVTQSFNEPVVGDVDKNYRLDTSAYANGLPSAVTGSNVVWDFTKVEGTFPVIFDSIVSPSSVSSGSLFPGATYAQKRGSIIAFFESGSAPSRTEWIGVYSPSLTITFTNSAIIATYPIAYGYSSTDPVTGTFKYNNTNGVCNGSLTIKADGIGTLLLPNNISFQNVLRVRSVEQLTMTTGFFPAGTISQSIFSYYVPGKKYPVISMQYQEYALIVGNPTITAQAYGNFDYFTVAGLNENDNKRSFSVYPNPFSDKLFIRGELDVPAEFFVFSLAGEQLFYGKNLDDFSGKDLPVGFYLLEIRRENHKTFQKIFRSSSGN